MNSQGARTSELWSHQMALNWKRCYGDVWCKLNAVNLNHEYFNRDIFGVYIIWHGGTHNIKPRVVYVDQGNIKDCIMKHRRDPDIQDYEPLGLYVTWARVPKKYRNSVKAYLADRWDPIVGGHYPEALPIEVNSPW